MKSFNKFLVHLLASPSKNTRLEIKGKARNIKGKARFTSINYEGEEYIKIAFNDHSHLVIIPSEKELYFTDRTLNKACGISDRMIGKKEITYEGNKYVLDNKDDYQFCLQVYVGKPNTDIEGECKFSDYVSEDGKEIFSLGKLAFNGKRADMLVTKLDLADVSYTN